MCSFVAKTPRPAVAQRGVRVAPRYSGVTGQGSPAAPSADDAATRRNGTDSRTGPSAAQRPHPLVDPVEPPSAKHSSGPGDWSALRQRIGLRRRRASMPHWRTKRISSDPSILRRIYPPDSGLDCDLARFIPILQIAGLDRQDLSLGSDPFYIVVERDD